MLEETQSSVNVEKAVKVEPKQGTIQKPAEEKAAVEIKQESRDEKDTSSKESSTESRVSAVEKSEPTSKKSQTKSPTRKSKSTNSSHPSPQRSFMHENYPPSYLHHGGRPPYPPPHAMHSGPRAHPGAGPFAPPPPPYYGGAPHDPYRGPPPPHYHQMPPLPHPGQYGPTGHYGHLNMPGRPGPPPGYPAPYGAPSYAPGPPMGYQGVPPPHQNYGSHQGIASVSDNHSISSSKSKGSHVSRSTKSSHGGKKRTIDGVHAMQEGPHAYAFRRTNSNASSSSTVTASNNTSDIHALIEESPRKRDRPSDHPRSYSNSASTNIFDEERFHRRNPSNASTTSSLSVGGFSLHSYDGPRGDLPMMKASPKRRKGSDSTSLGVDAEMESNSNNRRKTGSPADSALDGESSRFQQLSMNDNDKNREENGGNSLFMSLSTSPINHPEVDATPVKKNTSKKAIPKITIKTDVMDEDNEDQEIKKEGKPSPFRKPLHAGSTDAATPATGARGDSEPSTDERVLNKHLRGQTFTPLPHLAEQSPSNAVFSSINPTLSWSIAGDTPSLEDLAGCSWDDNDKTESKRPGSTTSQLSTSSRDMVISPHNFSIWKEDHETNHKKKDDGKDNDTVRLSMLSPNSEIGMAVEGVSGTTTPLPLFFHDHLGSEERENLNRSEHKASKRMAKEGENDHIHNMFVSNNGRGSAMKPHHPNPHYGWKHDVHGGPPTPVYGSKPPTPLYAGAGMGFARSPLHGDGRDHRMMFGHPPPHSHNDRVRNLRGRMPPGAHLPPMPLHIPPPMSSHHPLTSPMGIGQHGKPMWSPHHSMPPPMASPHHMSPMNMSQSKRKCVPLKPPIPSKFQGDMEKVKGAAVPEFTSLVNFPAHMSQKQSVNLPEGMRCCVMCGNACPCSAGNKKKGTKGKNDSSNSQDGGSMMADKGSYAIIPTQNKGLCTLCDVNVWVVVNNGLEIKWCKGCKNFRPWAAFGDKGLATKCLRCRERQREKYALQKEEKEKARLLKGAKAKA